MNKISYDIKSKDLNEDLDEEERKKNSIKENLRKLKEDMA